jgi:hypothetical protein
MSSVASVRLRAAAVALSLWVGCGDDDEPTPSDGRLDSGAPTGELGDAAASAGDAAPDAAVAVVRPALYAMNNEVYSGDESTTYVNVFKSLDISALDTRNAIELTGGRANIGVNDGRLFVAVPATPVIRRYAVADDGTFKPDGEISFANFGSTAVGLDEWANAFISPTKAYLAYAGAVIVWNPTTLEIVKEIDTSLLPTKEGANWAPDGSGMVVRGNRLYRTMYFVDWDAWTTSPESFLLAFDTDTDKLLSVTRDDRCPSLGNRPDRDEQGNLYFSNWIWNVPETIRNNAPKSCVLRLPAGSDKFDDWKLSYEELTGHEGAMFAYLGGGKAVVSAFHLEEGKNEPSMTLNELAAQDVWHLYSVDLATKIATPIQGLPANSGAVSTYHIDNRHYVFLPTEGWANTLVYELLGTSSLSATKRFEARGWSYQLYRLR